EFSAGRTGSSLPEAAIAERLEDWIEIQEVTSDGSGLLELSERLRERGYLSHALEVSDTSPPAWVRDLGAYSFESSRAGHSTDRINDLFTGLIERQEEVPETADETLLVGAVGDDEQFAVAINLIADYLGFESRIVLGTYLSPP